MNQTGLVLMLSIELFVLMADFYFGWIPMRVLFGVLLEFIEGFVETFPHVDFIQVKRIFFFLFFGSSHWLLLFSQHWATSFLLFIWFRLLLYMIAQILRGQGELGMLLFVNIYIVLVSSIKSCQRCYVHTNPTKWNSWTFDFYTYPSIYWLQC